MVGADAYRAWLQDRHDRAIEQLDGVHFDIPAPLRTIEVVLAYGSTSGAAYYTPPSEDLTRPGRTWWPLAGREVPGRFRTWSELSTVFHEGVPGHHLQAGATIMAGDTLSRFAKTNFVSGHGEGWALYAERLADELGWFADPGTRLGMLGGSAIRAARVVIDIGVHLDLPLPDGSRWTFERAREVLGGRAAASRTGSTPRWSATSAGRARPSPTSSASAAGWRPGRGDAAAGFRPEALAHRRPEPGPDRPGRPGRRAGRRRTVPVDPVALRGRCTRPRWSRRAGR